MAEKVNKLKVKQINIKKGEIVIHDEVERKKRHPIITFFLNNRLILLLFILLSLIIFISGLQLVLSSLDGASDPNNLLTTLHMDFHDGNGDVNVNGTIPFTNKKAKYNLYKKYGNIGLKDGVIFEVNTVNFKDKKVTYYTDGSAKIANNNGSIIRVSAFDDGSYGVDDNGNIINKGKRVNIRIENTLKLKNGNTIIYYSDGSAEIIDGKKIKFVRDGSDILLSKNNEYILKINPSEISFILNKKNYDNGFIEYYSDKTMKVNMDGIEYIVRNNNDIEINQNKISFPNNNAAKLLNKKVLDDGNTIIYYSDGSAEIIKGDGETLLVRKSGDIIVLDNKLKEIIQDEIGNRINKFSTNNGNVISIFDNGVAVIEYSDNSKKYVKDNSSIKYDTNGNINEIDGNKNKILKEVNLSNREKITIYEDGDAVIEYNNGKKVCVSDYNDIKYNKNKVIKLKKEGLEEINKKVLPDGTEVIEFANNLYEIIESDGNKYLVNNGKVIYDSNGNISKIETKTIDNVAISNLPNQTVITKFENDKYFLETPDYGIITNSGNIKYDNNGNVLDVETGLIKDMQEDNQVNKTLNEITITNPTNKDLKYRLVIEETDNYKKYNMNNLPVNYIKYLISVDYNTEDEKSLDNNVWTIDDILEGGLKIEKNTYILYEGTINAKSSVDVDLSLWIDYTELGNEYQNSLFVGTIRAYAWIEN